MINKLKAMIGRCILAAVSDNTQTQSLQIEAFAGDIHDDVERFQQFGFSGVPLTGAEGIVLFVAGNHDHPVVIAAENRELRVRGLKAGESAQYNSKGHKIVLYHDRCEITTPRFVVDAKTEAVIKAPQIKLVGQVAGTKSAVFAEDVQDKGGQYSMAAMREVYDRHTHHDNGQGSETDTPTQKAGK